MERNEWDHPYLVHEMVRAIRSPARKKEVYEMSQTIAEALREEGRLEGERIGRLEGKLEAKQQTLLLLMKHKFGRKVTSAMVSIIAGTQDLDKLDTWLVNILNAVSPAEVGIRRKKRIG